MPHLSEFIYYVVRHPQQFNYYLSAIEQNLIEVGDSDEHRLSVFDCVIRILSNNLHDIALTEQAEQFLLIPNLFARLVRLPIMLTDWYTQSTVERVIASICRNAAHLRGHELAFVIEENFLQGIFQEMRRVCREHEAEKKRRYDLLHPELVAAVLSPERAERMGAAYGMDAMTWLITNEGVDY